MPQGSITGWSGWTAVQEAARGGCGRNGAECQVQGAFWGLVLEEAATQDQRLRGPGVNSVGWGGTPEWAGNHFQVMLGANGSDAEPFHGPGCRIPTVASPAGPPCFLSPLRAAWMCSGLFTSWDRAWRRGGDTADPTLESRDPKFLSCSVSPAVASWRINLTSLSPGFSVEKMMLTP